MEVEQAIYTSAVTRRARGYQLVARSPGLCDADARELTVWCPSHDALLDAGHGAQSVNFHPLESGNYCVSRTTAAGAEYSDRGALRVTTQCLIASPDLLTRFANNPFAVLRAAIASGALDVGEPIPEHLPALQLPGRAPILDREALAQAASLLGIKQMAALLREAMSADSLGLVVGVEADRILAAMLTCLPVEFRTDISFSTGLKYSPRRPFRWFVASGEGAQQRRLEEQFGVNVVELDTSGAAAPLSANRAPEKGWAGYVAACLCSGRVGHLEAQLTRPRPGLTIDELEASGEQLTDALLADLAASNAAAAAPSVKSRVAHAHASHDRVRRRAVSEDTIRGSESPSQWICPNAPEITAQLETLDDTVYDAIAGKAEALTSLTTLWPEVLDRLGYDMVELSREQYLRFALSVWHDFIDQGDGGPEVAFAVLGVLEVLCDN